MSSYSIQDLIDFISRLPNVGQRVAKKVAIAMLKDKKKSMIGFANMLKDLSESVCECEICRNLDTDTLCSICKSRQNSDTICVVTNIDDLWNIEKSEAYFGLYFVLGGHLSTTSAILPKDLGVEKICEMILLKNTKEVIFALGSTMSSQTTYYYVLDELERFTKDRSLDIKFTSLAFGIPMGSDIDYLDEGTLVQGFRSRG